MLIVIPDPVHLFCCLQYFWSTEFCREVEFSRTSELKFRIHRSFAVRELLRLSRSSRRVFMPSLCIFVSSLFSSGLRMAGASSSALICVQFSVSTFAGVRGNFYLEGTIFRGNRVVFSKPNCFSKLSIFDTEKTQNCINLSKVGVYLINGLTMFFRNTLNNDSECCFVGFLRNVHILSRSDISECFAENSAEPL